MKNDLVRHFWRCGDSQIIEFAIMRARLNKFEKEALTLVLDECETQETAAEVMNISTRSFQRLWRSATNKLLSIPWVVAYARELERND